MKTKSIKSFSRFIRPSLHGLVLVTISVGCSSPLHSGSGNSHQSGTGSSGSVIDSPILHISPAEPDWNKVRSFSELTGSPVKNLRNEPLGQVSDLLIDITSQEVVYAVIEPKFGFDWQNRVFSIPTDQLMQHTDKKTLVFNMKRERRNASNNSDDASTSRDLADSSLLRVSSLIGKRVRVPSEKLNLRLNDLAIDFTNWRILGVKVSSDNSSGGPSLAWFSSISSLEHKDNELVLLFCEEEME